MSIYLEDYPGALQPPRTPFDDLGEPASPCCFIYMTNRYEGRWSYLMPIGFEREHDPAGRIGMGYTQLWIMQKLLAVAPAEHRKPRRQAHQLQFPDFEKGVGRDDYLQLTHVLRQPGANPHVLIDYLGGRRRQPDAVRFAHESANQLGVRVVVARLLHDWTWH